MLGCVIKVGGEDMDASENLSDAKSIAAKYCGQGMLVPIHCYGAQAPIVILEHSEQLNTWILIR